jgi:outer membrane protein assembly factor BamB
VAGIAVAVGAMLVLSGCWPVPGQNADRTAYNPFEDTITVKTVAGLGERWTAQLDSGGVGSLVRSTTEVHPTDGVALYGLDAGTGARRWRTPLTDLPSPGPFAVGPGFVVGDQVLASLVVFVLGGGGTTSWVDARTGAVERTVAGTGGVDSVRGSRAAAVNTLRGTNVIPVSRLVTVDVDSGALTVRPLLFVGQGVPRVTVGEDRIYDSGGGVLPPFDTVATPLGDVLTFDHEGNGVRALDLAQARICLPRSFLDPNATHDCGLWATPIEGSTATVPVIGPHEATLFVGTDAGTVYAINARTGAVRWTASVGSAVVQPPALAKGSLFVPTASGDLVVLAAHGCGAATCKPLWSAAAGSPLSAQPAVAGGVVFTGSESGAIRAFRAAGCRSATCLPLWSAEAGAAITGPPAVTGGQLFVGTADGRVVAYRSSGSAG